MWALLRQAPVIAVGALVLAILSGLGRSLGLPLLFWRATRSATECGEPRRARLAIGFAVGVLLSTCALVACLSEATARQAPPWFETWFDRSCGLAAGLLVVLAVPQLRGRAHRGMAAVTRAVRGDIPGRDASVPVGGSAERWAAWPLPLGGVIGVGGLWAGVRLLSSRAPGALVELAPPGGLAPIHVAAAVLFAIGAALYVLLWAANRFAGKEVYPAAALCLVLAVVVLIEGFVATHVHSGVAALLCLALLGYAVVNGRWQRACVADLERAACAAGDGTVLVADEEALHAWCRRHGTEHPVLVVVTATGGGIRAAVWTASVLARLEEKLPTFANHVRLVTGASGGMLGATCWAATLTSDGKHHDGSPLDAWGVVDRVQGGGLSAVASGLVFRDLWPPPFRVGEDRGAALERAWEEHCPSLGRAFRSLAQGEREGWRPSVVLSPMVVEDGRRLVISNLDLDTLLVQAAATLPPSPGWSRSGWQALAKWPAAADALRLSTAVRLQANFPWVLPSTEIPALTIDGPRCRVVDAGYYDDAGVDLACAWIRHHFEALRARTGGVVLLQVRDTPSIDRQRPPADRRPPVARGLDGLLTPVSAVLRARDATTWYRNDAAVAELSRRFEAAEGRAFFTTAIAEFSGNASLSWSLTGEEIADIRGCAQRPPVSDVLECVVARIRAAG